jgi:hypothetical protein
LARPSSIPTQRKRGPTDRSNLRSQAPFLDPTTASLTTTYRSIV